MNTNLQIDLKQVVDAYENSIIDQVLIHVNNNKKEASKMLNIKRTTLVAKLSKRGLIVKRPKKETKENE